MFGSRYGVVWSQLAAVVVLVGGLSGSVLAADPPKTTVAEEVDEGPDFFASVNQDTQNGFFVVVEASLALDDQWSLVPYGVLYASEAFALSDGSGSWTEAGLWLEYRPAESLSVRGALGVVSGAFLSGSDEARLAEGIVPSFAFVADPGSLHFEGFVSWYAGLYSDGPTASDFVWWGGVAGVSVASYLGVGALYERIDTRSAADGDWDLSYHWLGGYLDLNGDVGFMRFAAGYDDADATDSFYRVAFGANY
ncbi:MAG: DUF6733 family protein [Myxococcota bacterium]